jgi:hypothetical protein
MIQILEESEGNLVAFRVSGNVDKSDYDVMLPVLEQKIRQYGKIKVYAELMDVEAYSLRALYEDIRFDIKHASDFSKVALVGDSDWISWVATAARPFTSAEVKYFDFKLRDGAWAWIHEGQPSTGDRGQSPQSPA